MNGLVLPVEPGHRRSGVRVWSFGNEGLKGEYTKQVQVIKDAFEKRAWDRGIDVKGVWKKMPYEEAAAVLSGIMADIA